MVFLMMRGEISFSMVSARQGTGIMSKLSVYGREETKTWPKPWVSMVVLNATFDIGGEQKVDWKWYSWVGQAMQFPRFEVFFFKVPEVFHVHNFHKPAKTSIIASKPYNFLVHSNVFFDDERRNQLFHGIWAARESCQNCRFMGVKKPKRDQNRFLWWF